MKYLKFDLGKQKKGKMVKVVLTENAANIRLLNNSNMYNYEHGHEYSSVEGLATAALTEIRIPHDDHWFVVVDMKGIKKTEGRVNASITVV